MLGKLSAVVAISTICYTLYYNNINNATDSMKCDHSFGDEKWNYSKIFYNKSHEIKSGKTELKINLPKNDGDMISFVCVVVPDQPADSSTAAFSSIHSALTITLKEPAQNDQTINVVAKKHGY